MNWLSEMNEGLSFPKPVLLSPTNVAFLYLPSSNVSKTSKFNRNYIFKGSSQALKATEAKVMPWVVVGWEASFWHE